MQTSILHQLHEAPAGGHLGEDKTLHKLREHFYWPGHQKDVKIWCRTCKDCAARKTVPKRKAPLTPIKVGYLLQMIGIDFLGTLVETDAGNTYVLAVRDHFTKYMSAFVVANQEAETAANALMEEHFCDNGFPSNYILIREHNFSHKRCVKQWKSGKPEQLHTTQHAMVKLNVLIRR